ncbi:unnamed protein product [Aphanomyces euteiches]
MVFRLASLVSLNVVAAALNYGFSECVSNQRTLYYYSPTTQSCDSNANLTTLPPVSGLDCTVPCRRGYKLGADFSGPTPVSGCERCPNGQFSLGGGNVYSARMNSWQDSLPIEFDTQCSSRDANTGVWSNNCNSWTLDSSGGFVSSGNNSKIASTLNVDRLYSVLHLTATFVRSGNITFQFTVDTEPPYNGLTFMIDGIVALTQVSTTNGWSEVNFNVPAGPHVFAWQYSKADDVDWGLDRAALRVIELTGTSFSDRTCYPCGGDMTRSSRLQCRLCDANQYAGLDATGTFKCFACPANTFAPAGSMDASACIASRPCDATDLAVYYTPCYRNTRNVTRTWAQPMTCNASLASSISLPMIQENIACGDCTDGYYPDSTGACQTCPDGQVINLSGNYSYALNSSSSENASNTVGMTAKNSISLCSPCSPSTIMVRSQLYGSITRRGWSLWPTIVENGTAIRNGWKLTERGITRDTALSQQWTPAVPLVFNTTHINRGKIAVNYTLTNIPPSNSGNSAWLELYVNDQQIPLATSANGTFYQERSVSPRVSGNTTFAVNFVWRTSSSAVDKVANVLIRSVKLTGTADGGADGCVTCPTGYIPNANQSGCVMCPAGTAATFQSNGVMACITCPADMYSFAGSGICSSCGANTFSAPESSICRAKQILIDSTTSLMYNLSALQALVDPLTDLDATSGFLPATPLTSTTAYPLSSTAAMMLGVFRPIKPQVPTQYVVGKSSLTTSDTEVVGSPQSYAVGLAMSNGKDAGSNFLYNAGNFGLVQCTIPPRFNLFNAGGKMDITVLANGRGIRSMYTLGIVANGTGVNAYYSTSIDFICDASANQSTQPTLVVTNSSQTQMSWTTAAACPLCDVSMFSQTKSSCSLMGNQTVTYVPSVPCVGGTQPTTLVTVQTCASITLDKQTAGIAAGIVFLIIVLIFGLIVGLVLVYRKYKATLVEFLYLKGQVNNHELLGGGSTKSNDGAYNFKQKASNMVVSPEASGVSAEADEDEEEDVNIKPKGSVVM